MKYLVLALVAGTVWGQTTNLKAGRSYVVEMTGAVSRETALVFFCGVERLDKTLHEGDRDWAFAYRPKADCRYGAKPAGAVKVRVSDYGRTRQLELEPNDEWGQGTEIDLGQVVFGSGDDSAYLPAPSVKRGKPMEEFGKRDQDWYRFRFTGGAPK
ncbi:MAG: hypothetical protein ACK6DZ_23035, partial [Acidobacteriota bacterium]